MEVWVIGNQKGGVGKTTLAVNIHGVLSQAGVKSVVLDQDPQQASMNWARRRCAQYEVSDVGVIAWTPALSQEVLDQIKDELNPDVLIVDLPAGVLGAANVDAKDRSTQSKGVNLHATPASAVRPEVLAALDLASIIIVPMSTTKLDWDSSIQFLSAIKKHSLRMAAKGVIQSSLVVMNRVATDSVEQRTTTEFALTLRDMGFTVASRPVPAYKCYSGPMWKGMTCADHNVLGRRVIVDLLRKDIAPLSDLSLKSKNYDFIRPSKVSLEG